MSPRGGGLTPVTPAQRWRSVSVHVGPPRPRLRPPPLDRHRRLGRRCSSSSTASSGAVGPDYRTDFTLPDSETEGRPGAARGERPRTGRLHVADRGPSAEQGVDDPAVQATLRGAVRLRRRAGGHHRHQPVRQPAADQRRRHDRLRPARRRRPRLRGGRSTLGKEIARRSATSSPPSRACRSSTAATCSPSSSCPRARSTASSPPSSS